MPKRIYRPEEIIARRPPEVVRAVGIRECDRGDEGDRSPEPLSLHVGDFTYKLE